MTADRDKSALTVSVCGIPITYRDGRWYTHHSFGRVVEGVAARVTELHYHGPERAAEQAGDLDHAFAAENIHVHPWFARRNTLAALKRPWRLIRDFWSAVGRCDAILLRGSLPFAWSAHWFSLLRGRRALHWLVGNPVAVLKAEERGYGGLTRRLGILFARFEQIMTRIGVLANRSYVLANGAEVAKMCRSRRTRTIVSTNISEQDFREQEDTCRGESIRLLFVGFIRPEKGIEFLVRAMPLIQSDRPVHLSIVGAWGKFSAEKDELDKLITELDLQERVTWEGYASFGPALFGHIDRADIVVLPSLSEGTPRVLVEARARSVPIVSTTVGGIPTSVNDDEDGLLVPPKDHGALAGAISRIINEPELRQRFIQNGFEHVREWTVERFVDLVLERLSGQVGCEKT